MTVETASPKVEKHRKMLTALLLADHPTPCAKERTTGGDLLDALARRYSVTRAEYSVLSTRPPDRPKDLSSPVIAVDHQACILCDRCVRACDEIQCNEVIGRTGKGELVYSMKCDNLPAPPPPAQAEAREVPAAEPAPGPEVQRSGIFGWSYDRRQ